MRLFFGLMRTVSMADYIHVPNRYIGVDESGKK